MKQNRIHKDSHTDPLKVLRASLNRNKSSSESKNKSNDSTVSKTLDVSTQSSKTGYKATVEIGASKLTKHGLASGISDRTHKSSPSFSRSIHEEKLGNSLNTSSSMNSSSESLLKSIQRAKKKVEKEKEKLNSFDQEEKTLNSSSIDDFEFNSPYESSFKRDDYEGNSSINFSPIFERRYPQPTDLELANDARHSKDDEYSPSQDENNGGSFCEDERDLSDRSSALTKDLYTRYPPFEGVLINNDRNSVRGKSHDTQTKETIQEKLTFDSFQAETAISPTKEKEDNGSDHNDSPLDEEEINQSVNMSTDVGELIMVLKNNEQERKKPSDTPHDQLPTGGKSETPMEKQSPEQSGDEEDYSRSFISEGSIDLTSDLSDEEFDTRWKDSKVYHRDKRKDSKDEPEQNEGKETESKDSHDRKVRFGVVTEYSEELKTNVTSPEASFDDGNLNRTEENPKKTATAVSETEDIISDSEFLDDEILNGLQRRKQRLREEIQ